MNPFWLAPIFLAGGLVGISAAYGLVEDPTPCTPHMQATWAWEFSPLDDEGASEARGDLKRGDWQNIRWEGDKLLADCNLPSASEVKP